jgi:hypothetical protein
VFISIRTILLLGIAVVTIVVLAALLAPIVDAATPALPGT